MLRFAHEIVEIHLGFRWQQRKMKRQQERRGRQANVQQSIQSASESGFMLRLPGFLRLTPSRRDSDTEVFGMACAVHYVPKLNQLNRSRPKRALMSSATPTTLETRLNGVIISMSATPIGIEA